MPWPLTLWPLREKIQVPIAYHSIHLQPHPSLLTLSLHTQNKIFISGTDAEPIPVDINNIFEETSSMKQNGPKGQGTDAALEQLIKRSKKGVKIKVSTVKAGIASMPAVFFTNPYNPNEQDNIIDIQGNCP